MNEEEQKIIDEMKEHIKQLNKRIEQLERMCESHLHIAPVQGGPTTQPIYWQRIDPMIW